MSRVLVLGAGVSGVAATHLLRSLGEEPVVYDRDPAALSVLPPTEVETLAGEWTPELLSGVNWVVTSPGFPETGAPIADVLSAGLPLLSEVELAYRHLNTPLIAVTGTNGKTTVTELIAAMLSAQGLKAPPVGNIGTPLTNLVNTKADVAVVEMSSFQLRFIDRFRPVIAVFTNLATDHLDWHGSLTSYRQAKARIVENQIKEDLLIYDATDPGISSLPLSTPATLAGVRPILPASGELEATTFPPGRSPTKAINTALAEKAACWWGVDPDIARAQAEQYQPAPHRFVLVGEWEGVRYINDSKATNPHAAQSALDDSWTGGEASVLLLAGGQTKGLDLSPLLSHPGLKRVFAFGEARATLSAADPDLVEPSGSLPDAVRAAQQAAVSGDTVLLAPGGASFDAYASYAKRGEEFTRLVLEKVSTAPDGEPVR